LIHSSPHPFQLLALGVVVVGGCSTLLFHGAVAEKIVDDETGLAAGLISAEEPSAAREEGAGDGHATSKSKGAYAGQRSAASWFSQREFYLCGGKYMCARLMSNLSLTYLPFFVLDSLQMSFINLSTAPAVLYVASFLSTFIQCKLAMRLSCAEVFAVGASISVVACVGCAMLPSAPSPGCLVLYPLITLLGVGTTTCMVTAVASQAELIGKSTSSAAFVYGAMSFLDKFSNGVAIFCIQRHRQSLIDTGGRENSAAFVRQAFTVGCGAAAIAGVAFASLLRLGIVARGCG